MNIIRYNIRTICLSNQRNYGCGINYLSGVNISKYLKNKDFLSRENKNISDVDDNKNIEDAVKEKQCS